MIFLIHYSRDRGSLLSLETFDDSEASSATDARLELEIWALSSEEKTEIVLLRAPSEADLRRTHGRYFGSIDEIRAAERTSRDNQLPPPKK